MIPTTIEGRKAEVAFAELFKANFSAHLAFYRRSRLLLAFLLVFLLLTGLSTLPAIFMHSGVASFNTLQQIFSVLNVFLLFLAAGLGLFVISSHLRNRSLKMVFTKPCTPAVWLASAFLSAVFVSFLLNGVVFVSTVMLSLFWHLPVRAGLVFLSLDTFVSSIGITAYLMLLATLVHPAIAAVIPLIFNADLFYAGQTWAQAVIRSGNSSMALKAIARVFHYLYLMTPMTYAFGKQTENIYSSLRVGSGEWKYLPFSLGYVAALSIFCYLLALFALKRKKHI